MTPDPQNAQLHAVAVEIGEALRREKRVVDDEIRVYPTPIPRCDAQFNHLYDQRARLAGMLSSLDAALDGRDDDAIRSALCEFVAAPALLENVEAQRLQERARAALRATSSAAML